MRGISLTVSLETEDKENFQAGNRWFKEQMEKLRQDLRNTTEELRKVEDSECKNKECNLCYDLHFPIFITHATLALRIY